MTESDRILTSIVQDIMRTNPEFGKAFMRRQPNYRYFPVKGSHDQPFWTVEPICLRGKKRYASGIYKHIKSRGIMKLTKPRYHLKRKDAKARALKLWGELK